MLRASTPSAYFGVYKVWTDQKQVREMIILVGFYIFFFSMVGHKEPRFMLPISPFLFLFAGYVFIDFTKTYPRLMRIFVWGGILVDLTIFQIRQSYHDRFWDAMEYITDQGVPHSLYSMHRFETPYYSWLH